MSVFKRKDRAGAWTYEFVLGGRRHRGYCEDDEGRPATTRTAALQAETRLRAAALGGRRPGPALRAGDYTIAQACAALLKRAADRGRKPRHLLNLKRQAADVLAFFGPALTFRELDQARADAYLERLRGQPVKIWRGSNRKATAAATTWRDTGRRRAPGTINGYLIFFRQLLALARRVRDPLTDQAALQAVVELELEPRGRRLPRPIPDAELAARQAKLPPWGRDAAELSRLFGLRAGEALSVALRHVDADRRGLRFAGGETKSADDVVAFGGSDGWRLVLRLAKQARARGVQHLVTRPANFSAWRYGKPTRWQPLKSLKSAWRRSAERAGVAAPHRFHDVRARYITEVAKIMPAAAQRAARHQDPATTALYIGIADTEVARAVNRAQAGRPARLKPGRRLGTA